MNERTTRRANSTVGSLTRGLAFRFVLILVIGTALGSTLPEAGDILALRLGIWPHDFNVVFCIVGFLGIGLAYYLRHRPSSLRNKILVVKHESTDSGNLSRGLQEHQMPNRSSSLSQPSDHQLPDMPEK